MATGLSINGRPPRIVFAGGGTAGHVFPGIAVAEELGEPVLWIGSSAGVERRLLAEAGIEFRGIPAGKLRRYLSLENLADMFRTVAGIVASVRILLRERPVLLFSKGGFVSVPPVVAAWLCGIPSWTHESDFDPGLATRINLRFSEKVLVSFSETVGFLPPRYRDKAVVTGNPVRPAIYGLIPIGGGHLRYAPRDVPLLLVLGGSLASAAINALVAGCLPALCARGCVVHQTGAGNGSGERGKTDRYIPLPFIGAELPDLMAGADIVITRAGANTLSELAALGKPSILVPLPRSSSRGDQLRNAEVFRAAGASVVLPEEKTSPADLAAAVSALLQDRQRLGAMGEAARSLAGQRPAASIAALVRERIG